MPSPSDSLIDERYRELAAVLRDARPRPPDRLREQVRELALAPVVEPAPRFRLRRLAPLALALVVTAALAGGVALVASRSSGTGGDRPLAGEALPAQRESASPKALTAPVTVAGDSRTALPPSGGRAQEYRAQLSVRVRDVGELSSATSRAMKITRSLGGFVVAASYDEPGDADGDSVLVVRVPVGRVQDAIARFSQLGTILAQHISVADLQTQLDRQADAIDALRRRIVRLETQLEDKTLRPDTRERLRLQLLEARRSLTAREGGRAQTKRRAATARVALTLTTRDQAEPVPVPAEDESGFSKTLKDALGILLAVLTWTLAALIVASPLLVLVALLAIALRMRRRAEERRLLERPAG